MTRVGGHFILSSFYDVSCSYPALWLSFSQRAIVHPIPTLKKIISIIASQNKEKRRCGHELELLAHMSSAFFHVLAVCLSSCWGGEAHYCSQQPRNRAGQRGRGDQRPRVLPPNWILESQMLRPLLEELSITCCLQWNCRNKRGRSAGIKEVILAQDLPVDRGVTVLASYCTCARVTDPRLLSLWIPSFDVLLNLELS